MHIYRTLVQPFSYEYMQNPDVKKRLKAFDDEITTKLVNNDTLEDDEDPLEGWHLDDTTDIENFIFAIQSRG